MKNCSSCGHNAEFGFVTTCDDCFDQESKEVDDIIESLTKKNTEILEYCEAYIDQMWAANIVSIILECDFRDTKQKLKEYFVSKE